MANHATYAPPGAPPSIGEPVVLEDGTPFTVRPIDKSDARDLIVANHYSHSWATPFGTYCFGVFDGLGLAGALAYGYPMNPASVSGIAALAPEQVAELNRMWIDDRLGPNTETAAMARAHKWLRANSPVQLIQTFADGRLGCGTVYKAANFTYHGHDDTLFFRSRASGDVLHGVPFTDTRSPSGIVDRNARLARGEFEAFTVKTYRYLYPLTKYLADAKGWREHADDIAAYMRATYPAERITAALDAARDNEWARPHIERQEAEPDLFGLMGEGAA